MKNLQNLKGAKSLNKKEQQSINGGGPTSGSGNCHHLASCSNDIICNPYPYCNQACIAGKCRAL